MQTGGNLGNAVIEELFVLFGLHPRHMQAVPLAAKEQATPGREVVAERLTELWGTVQRDRLLARAVKRALPGGHFGKGKRVAQGVELRDRAWIHLRRNA